MSVAVPRIDGYCERGRTHDTVQAEQIRRMTVDEYIREKTEGGVDGQKHTE